MRVVALTTIDNPYSPITQYDNWLAFDEQQQYYTNSFLDRVAIVSPELSAQDEEEEIERAIDEIVSMNVLGIYRKIEEDI